MRKILLALGLLIFFAPSSRAQDQSQWEIYGGYAFTRFQIQPPTPAGSGGFSQMNTQGYDLSGAQYVNRWLGGYFDFGDYYRKPTIPGTTTTFDTHAFSILAGPQFRFSLGPATPFIRGGLGLVHVHPGNFSPVNPRNDLSFAFSLGAGVDVRVNSFMAIRVFQADYIRTRFEQSSQNDARASAGLVFRIGHR